MGALLSPDGAERWTRSLAAAEATLDDDRAALARTLGATLTDEQTIADALASDGEASAGAPAPRAVER